MNICSNCHHPIESTTEVYGDNNTPAPGAISICFYCGQICVFEEDLSLRKITQDELDDLKMNDHLVYRLIHEAVKAIKDRIMQN